MKYKAIVFDVGDTLFEYTPNWAQIYGDKIRSLGIDVAEDTIRKINDALYWAQGEQILKEQNGAPRAADDEFSGLLDAAALSCVHYPSEMKDTYLKMMSLAVTPKQEVSVISGVFQILDILKTNYRLAVVSNYSKSLIAHLQEFGLYDYFEVVVVSEIVGIEKPDARIMEFVLDKLDLSPESCLYVGDHPLDVLCAKKAGMDCAWIARPDAKLHASIPFREDYRINHITELMDIL